MERFGREIRPDASGKMEMVENMKINTSTVKTIVSINSVKNGSTGNIMNSLAREGRKRGYKVYTSCAGNLYQRGLPTECSEYHLYIGGIFENKLHKTLGSIFGGGCYSQIGTKIFIHRLKKIRPDLIHIHNLHSNYINLKLLFQYLKKTGIPVVWTLHDCWAFTGHCPHFDMVGCYKWKQKCRNCQQYREYPEALFDDAYFMYGLKKEAFTGVPSLTLVTPSEWLASLVRQSFLKDYPVKVIHNGISLSVFQHRDSNFREEYGICQNQKILLGVSFSWGLRKGLDIFVDLAEKLDVKQYRIVLVGTNAELDRQLPESIVSIHFTENQVELSKIYSAADVFVNPTREDNFPTVNMEALACGTPVVTFDTGGSPEIIDSSCGAVVEKDDVEGLITEIEKIVKVPGIKEKCRQRAEEFDAQQKQQEYLELYEQILRDDAES